MSEQDERSPEQVDLSRYGDAAAAPLPSPALEERTLRLGVHYATTPQMRRIAALAERRGYPHRLDWRLDVALDPDGTHMLFLGATLADGQDTAAATQAALEQMEKGQPPVCHALLKMRGRKEPVTVDRLSVHLSDLLGLPAGTSGGTSRSVQVPMSALLADSDPE